MNPLSLALLMVFHPIDAYDEIKLRRNRRSALASVTILLLVILMRYLYVLTVHRPLADIRIQDTNMLLEIGRFLLPILSIVVSLYAVTRILYGETTFLMTFNVVCYSMIPFLLLTPIQILLSRILSNTSAGLFGALHGIMWAWIVLLVFVSIQYMNTYTFRKTVAVSLLSLIGILLMWALAITVIALVFQVIGFFNELTREFILDSLL